MLPGRPQPEAHRQGDSSRYIEFALHQIVAVREDLDAK